MDFLCIPNANCLELREMFLELESCRLVHLKNYVINVRPSWTIADR